MRGFAFLPLHSTSRLLLIALSFLIVAPVVNAQGSGKSSTGTGGIHVIQGYVFFPSGRKADGNIVVKLQSYNCGELTLIADSSGAFTFSGLAAGNYPFVINAGSD